MKWNDKEGQAALRRILREERRNVAEEIARGLDIEFYPYDAVENLLAAGRLHAALPKGYTEEGYRKSTLCRLLVKILISRLSVGDIHSAEMQLRGLGKPKKDCDEALARCERLLDQYRSPKIDVKNLPSFS